MRPISLPILLAAVLVTFSSVSAAPAPFDPNQTILDIPGAYLAATYRNLVNERNGLMACPSCKGAKKCVVCKGTGKVKGSALAGGHEVKCVKCQGTTVCPVCRNGTKKVDVSHDARYLAVAAAIHNIEVLRKVYAAVASGTALPAEAPGPAVDGFNFDLSPSSSSGFAFAKVLAALAQEQTALAACPSCRGAKKCMVCDGKGKVEKGSSPCPKCGGTGVCPVCGNGTKQVNATGTPCYQAVTITLKSLEAVKQVYDVSPRQPGSASWSVGAQPVESSRGGLSNGSRTGPRRLGQ